MLKRAASQLRPLFLPSGKDCKLKAAPRSVCAGGNNAGKLIDSRRRCDKKDASSFKRFPRSEASSSFDEAGTMNDGISEKTSFPGPSLYRLRDPDRRIVARATVVLRRLAWPLLGGLVLLLAFLSAALVRFGSLPAVWAFMSNQPVYCETARVDLGVIGPQEQRTVCYRLKSITDEPVKVLGIETSCVCVAADREAFPIEIGPSEEKNLLVKVYRPVASGPFEYRIRAFLDQGASELHLSFFGEVREVSRLVGGWIRHETGLDCFGCAILCAGCDWTGTDYEERFFGAVFATRGSARGVLYKRANEVPDFHISSRGA